MRRTLAVVVVALWALIGLPGMVHAGGPTSVLITQPGTGEATALYYSSGAYVDLDRLLAESTVRDSAAEPLAGSGGTTYTLTWMIHDVQPWRIDTVQFTGDGAAYVSTTSVSDPDLRQEGSMREVARPRALAALLEQAFSGAAAKSAPLAAIDTEPVTQPDPAPAPAEEPWVSLSGWRWVLPGVLGGLLVGLLAGRRSAPAEPRRVLVDADPQRVGG